MTKHPGAHNRREPLSALDLQTQRRAVRTWWERWCRKHCLAGGGSFSKGISSLPFPTTFHPPVSCRPLPLAKHNRKPEDKETLKASFAGCRSGLDDRWGKVTNWRRAGVRRRGSGEERRESWHGKRRYEVGDPEECEKVPGVPNHGFKVKSVGTEVCSFPQQGSAAWVQVYRGAGLCQVSMGGRDGWGSAEKCFLARISWSLDTLPSSAGGGGMSPGHHRLLHPHFSH